MIACVTHHDGYVSQSSSHSGPPPALSCDQFICITVASDYQRLNDALVSYRRSEFFDFGFIKRPPRLKGAWRYPIDFNSKAESFVICLNSRLGRPGNQGAEPSTQAFFR
jgi:hypothetical protein